MATYVLSDIHGHLEYLEDILRQIELSDEDKLYVIGDAIDRGPKPIETLKKIKSLPNTTFLLGNHEHMMLQALWNDDPAALSNWMMNGGGVTLDQFEELPESEQFEILEWLYSCPIAIPNLMVGEKQYYLAHASHPNSYIEEPLYYSEASREDTFRILWSRDYEFVFPDELAERFSYLYSQYKKTTLIFGHTPVYKTNYGVINRYGHPRISRTGSGHLINIDCGCARGLPLGCLRLDDQKEFYSKLPDGLKIGLRRVK